MAAAAGCLPAGQRRCCWRSSASTAAALPSTPRTPSRIGCAKQPSHLWVAGAPCANANTHHAHHPGAAAAAAAAGAAAGAPAGTKRTSRAAMPALGESLLLRCDRIGSGGVGVCLAGDSRLVVLVRGALPGEQLQATVTALHKGHAEAVRTASLEPPFDATAPHCPHFGTCGGCSLQGVSYDTQLTYKVGATAQLLARVGGLDAAAVATSAAAPVAAPAGERLAYRSKMQLTFGSRVWQQHGSSAGCTPSTSTSSSTSSTVQVQERMLPPAQAAGLSAAAAPHSGWTPPPGGQVVQGWALGYLLPGSSDVVMPLQECALVAPEVNTLVHQVVRACLRQGLRPHDAEAGGGELRHLIVRRAERGGPAASSAPHHARKQQQQQQQQQELEGELMAVFVTTPGCSPDSLRQVAQELMAVCPGLVSVVHSTTRAEAGSTRGGTGTGAGSSRHARRAPRLSRSVVLAGKGTLQHSLGGLLFEASPSSFFQAHTRQAERLYDVVAAAVADGLQSSSAKRSSSSSSGGGGGGDSGMNGSSSSSSSSMAGTRPLVLDLYCGTGTITQLLGARLPGCDVLGVDESAAAISDARKSAVRNGLDAAAITFVCADADALCRAVSSDASASTTRGRGRGRGSGRGSGRGGGGRHPGSAPGDRSSSSNRGSSTAAAADDTSGAASVLQRPPSAVVVDPARAGLSAGVRSYLSRCGAGRIIYVSCNPATLSRDLSELCGPGGGFTLQSWTAVDLFPQTEHLEVVAVLEAARAAS